MNWVLYLIICSAVFFATIKCGLDVESASQRDWQFCYDYGNRNYDDSKFCQTNPKIIMTQSLVLSIC